MQLLNFKKCLVSTKSLCISKYNGTIVFKKLLEKTVSLTEQRKLGIYRKQKVD